MATYAAAARIQELWRRCAWRLGKDDMAELNFDHPDIELREQEAVRRLRYGFALDRRAFFKLMGGGVLICLSWKTISAQESGARSGGENEPPTSLAAWLHVNESGTVTVFTG